MDYDTYGEEIACDIWGVDFSLLNDLDRLLTWCIEAAELAGATVISHQEKQFSPNGVTVLVMLEESHVSLHSYPSRSFAALNCYTCGNTCDPNKAIDYLIEKLKPDPDRIYRQTIIRGIN